MRIVVFASGRGSNFEAIQENIAKGILPDEITALITDNADAQAIAIARRYKIPAYIVETDKRTGLLSADEERRIMQVLKNISFDIIVLAGFMHIFSGEFLERLNGCRIVNIHPSLLPQYKGLNPHKRVIADAVRFSGCTVHFVNDKVDSGDIICQQLVEVEKEDNEETLASRILKYEHIIYSEALNMIRDV